MLFQPSHSFQLITEKNYSSKIKEVESTLQQYCVKGKLSSFDRCELAYEYYLAADSKATIVLVHGFTEFYKKYYEMTWYFLNQGYNVFLYDQRGHGLSDREVPDLELTHVNSYKDYVRDLNAVITKLVLPTVPDKPVYLYTHSMGGAVALLYLAKYPEVVTRAVLSSPMIDPKIHGVPVWFAKQLAEVSAAAHGWNGRFCFSSSFNPNAAFFQSHDSSRARFAHYMDYRIQNTHYRNSASSNRWIYLSVGMRDRILRPEITDKIKAKLLLLRGGKDSVVHSTAQYRLCDMVKDCNIKFFPSARHSIYSIPDADLTRYYHTLFAFYR